LWYERHSRQGKVPTIAAREGNHSAADGTTSATTQVATSWQGPISAKRASLAAAVVSCARSTAVAIEAQQTHATTATSDEGIRDGARGNRPAATATATRTGQRREAQSTTVAANACKRPRAVARYELAVDPDHFSNLQEMVW